MLSPMRGKVSLHRAMLSEMCSLNFWIYMHACLSAHSPAGLIFRILGALIPFPLLLHPYKIEMGPML